MTPEQNCCFGLRNGKGNKKPLSYEKFGNIVLEERNFEIIRSCALYFIPQVKELGHMLLHKNFAKDYSHNSLKYLTHLLLDWRKFSLRKNNRQIILFYQRKIVILQKIYKDK